MVCVPNGAPKCESCPLQELCLANAYGTWEKYPVKEAKKAKREEEKTVFYLTCDGCLAVRKRESRGLLAGLWELPNVEGKLDAAQALSFAEKAGCEPAELLKKCRAGACVHAHHLAHALLLYSMQGEKPGICLGERCAAQNGCGAADSVPDVRRRGNIKASPYRGSVRGCFVSWETQPICGRAARLAASCSSVGMVSVMVPLLKAS